LNPRLRDARERFFRNRGADLGMVVLIMLATSLTQGAISYSMSEAGALRRFMPSHASPLLAALVAVRFGLIALMAVLWVVKRRRILFRVIIFANAMFTLALLFHMKALLSTLLSGSISEAIVQLLLDVIFMAVSNILIFSIWYWVMDPPGVEGSPRDDEPWDFLFPQRSGSLPHYESWAPHYVDYLFLAFTASFAFSPTDTLPLTRRAKMLMLLQSSISIVTMTAIAGSAINILAART